MKNVVLPRVKAAMSLLDERKYEISERAIDVAEEVRRAAKYARDAIQAHEQRQIQAIRRIEKTRTESLDYHRGTLERHAEDLVTAIALTEQLGENGGLVSQEEKDVKKLERRTLMLETEGFGETPHEHSFLSLEQPQTTT